MKPFLKEMAFDSPFGCSAKYLDLLNFLCATSEVIYLTGHPDEDDIRKLRISMRVSVDNVHDANSSKTTNSTTG